MRKKMKKNLMIGTLLLTFGLVTSCSVGNDKADSKAVQNDSNVTQSGDTTLPIDVSSTQLETMQHSENVKTEADVTTETKEETSVTTVQTDSGSDDNNSSNNSGGSFSGVSRPITLDGYPLVPDVSETHGNDIPLNILKIDGVELDILDLTVDEVWNMTQTEFKSAKRYTIGSGITEDFKYLGIGFMKSINGREYEPVFHVEMLYNDELISQGILKENANQYEVKGIEYTIEHSDNYFDYIEFYGGIKLGMTRNDVEGILGEGIKSEKSSEYIVYYRTPVATMAIIYNTEDYITFGDEISATDVIETIVLLKNY